MFTFKSPLLLVCLITSTTAQLLPAAEGDKPSKGAIAVAKAVPVPGVPVAIRDAMQNRNFKAAVELIDKELAKPKPASADFLTYLKGRAQTEQEQFDAAITTFETLLNKFPQSRWTARARFGRAEVFARKRDYRRAGEIYQTEAQRLLSDDRRDELAKITLEFADRFFEGVPTKGPGEDKKKDFKQADFYYRETLKLTPSLPVRQRIAFRLARCSQELNAHKKAVNQYRKFLSDFADDDTPQANRAPAGLELEARYHLGSSLLKLKQNAAARKVWQDLLRNRPAKEGDSELIAKVNYELALTHGVPQPPNISGLERGVAALERFVKKYPKHELSAKAEFQIAQSYLHHGRHEAAIARLKLLIGNAAYKDSQYLANARQSLGQSYLAQQQFDEAIAAWKEFLEKHPTNSGWSNVQAAIVNAEFTKAEHARGQKKYAEARNLWSTFLNKYPLDSRAPQILLRFGQMKLEEAGCCETDDKPKAKLTDAETKLLEQAIADWRRLTSKYPNNAEASQAAYLIGTTLENQLGRLKEALEAYKKVKGNYAAAAKQRIAGLTAKQLQIVTRRKFRSNEKPEITLHTRNIEAVTVKVYRVDLADYFRKMHLTTGVESLDISLIDPDKSWEYKIENYEEFRRVTNAAPIPVDGPGVTAVSVSSEKLEATTMVIVSDLDVIVKASRNELFVFAENIRTQKPQPGASLLISDGEKVFAEAVTGDDGVLQKSFEELKSAGDVRVFAVQEGHVASTVNQLNGLKFATGLAPKAYLYTDRPAYRAGELVNLKGVIRHVEKDVYTFKAGEEYDVKLLDPSGRQLLAEKVKLSDFGTFATRFELPDSASVGNYRIQVQRPNRSESFDTSFQVHEIQLEPVRIEVELDESIVFRGEKITGEIELAYYYGTPLPERTLTYQLGSGRTHTAKTDAAGKIKFEFETDEHNESVSLPLTVTYGERNLYTRVPVLIATREFGIGVSTSRRVYLAGETFDVTSTVADPAGEAVKEKAVTLEVFKQTDAGGELRIASHPLKTDKDKGVAKHTLRIDDAGSYLLRTVAEDRFGNRVTGQKHVTISGDEDTIRLRILADKHSFKVGETAKVQVHWREKPALALVSYEGASILGHRLVNLKTGANEVAVPMEAKLAPNFRFAIDIMHDDKLHRATSDFVVTRTLKIELKPNQTTLQPGDELKVDVIVTDSAGKPVSAELSLALLQQNLLERFGNGQPISAIYGGGFRQPAIRISTSATFTYRPRTRAINKELLADAAWRAMMSAEQESLRTLVFSDGANWRRFSGPQDPFGENANNGDAAGALAGGQFMENFDAPNAPGQSMPGLHLEGGVDEKTSQSLNQLELSAIPFAGQMGQRPNHWGAIKGQNKAGKDSGISQTRRGYMYKDLYSSRIPSYSFYVQLNDGQSHLKQQQLNEVSNFAGTLYGLNRRGELQVVNGLPVAELDRMQRDEGLAVLPHLAASETGYWNPMVVTDAKGVATVSFRLPERSTAWGLECKGVTADTVTGQAAEEIITKKELFAEIKAPTAFTDGDKAQMLVEVHHGVAKAGDKIDVTLTAKIGDKSLSNKQTVTVKGPGIAEVLFPVEIAGGDRVEFTVALASGERKDTATASVPIHPYGTTVHATASGSAAQSMIALVEFDKKIGAQDSRLEILVGPSVNRSLLDTVLGAAPLSAPSIVHPLERTVSDVLGAVSLLDMLNLSRAPNNPDAQALSARIQSGIASLTSSQRKDGGWSWSGNRAAPQSDAFLTSRVVWALSAVKKAGFSVPDDTRNKAVTFLKTAFSKAGSSKRDEQAILLHGLAMAGSADFAFANRLYRERHQLSQAGVLHLSLTLAKLDRKTMAKELLSLIKLPIDIKTAGNDVPDDMVLRCVPWMRSGVELRALYLLAVQQAGGEQATATKLADWLMAARSGSRWSPEKANGPAIAALGEWFSRTKFAEEKYKLTVFVNDRQVEVLNIDPAVDSTRRLSVPARMLVDGRQRINFDLEGRGRFTFSAVLSGFVAADKLKSTTNEWTVARIYEPAVRIHNGQPLPRGFGILTPPYKTFTNPLTQLPMGERGEVTLKLSRRQSREQAADYLVVTEPLPAGAMVLTESIRGTFERYELRPGSITFYLGNRRGLGDIHYSLAGYLPGEYRVVPTQVRSFYRPEKLAVAEPKTLTILNRGEQTKDEYKLTPNELYHLGKRLFAARDYKTADVHLSKLFHDDQLNANVYNDVVQMLFRTSLELGKDQYIVEYFEIIKEKLPEVEVDFASILKVAGAYRELGEYERSYLVYRATVEGRFQRESQIAGSLEKQGEFLKSMAVLWRLLGEFPAEPYIATATYSLSGELFGKAESAASDKKLKAAGVTRVDLMASSIQATDHFLTTWPKDPAADAAAFSIANSLLELKQHKATIKRSEAFAARYPNSDMLDSFWYIIGYSQFALGEHQAALKTCEKVAEAKRKDPNTGVELAAVNKWEAIYIMGQIYHSLDQPQKAIAEYKRVGERFPDAGQAIDFFTRKQVKLPEVTTIKPSEAAKVPLSFRNVESLALKVYRIDLLKFGLMQRNLDRITAINLAGIRPYHEMSVKLGDGKDFRDREQDLTLPLKEEGAYLLVGRGGNLYASGLVLVSPLGLELQEDATSGRVRVTVRNTVNKQFVDDVLVKVIGSSDKEFQTGRTDLRGLYIADNVTGTSTVIAQAGENKYAFHRGEKVLGKPPQPANQNDAKQVEPQPAAPQSGKGQLLDNLRGQNYFNNSIQRKQFQGIINNGNQGGVKSKAAY